MKPLNFYNLFFKCSVIHIPHFVLILFLLHGILTYIQHRENTHSSTSHSLTTTTSWKRQKQQGKKTIIYLFTKVVFSEKRQLFRTTTNIRVRSHTHDIQTKTTKTKFNHIVLMCTTKTKHTVKLLCTCAVSAVLLFVGYIIVCCPYVLSLFFVVVAVLVSVTVL